MIAVKIGVVAEGATDCIVFNHLIPAYLRSRNISKVALSFRNLQPFVDNTSKSGYSDGGWELVYKWCLSNPSERRRDLYLSKPLFADEMDDGVCDALMLHLDSDICEQIGDKSTVLPVPKVIDPPEKKGEFIRKVLIQWLWKDGEHQEDNHILVPAVDSVETWLVAGLSGSDVTPESHPDIQRRLAELNYERYRGRQAPATMRRLRKSIREYERMANDAAANVLRIVALCPHFLQMLQKIIDVISEHLPKSEPNSAGLGLGVI